MGWVIEICGNGYLETCSGSGVCTFTDNIDTAILFPTHKDAQSFLDELIRVTRPRGDYQMYIVAVSNDCGITWPEN